MKISDLQNYEIPHTGKQKFSFFKGNKYAANSVSKFKIGVQSTIDFTMCNIIRVFIGIVMFKFLTRNIPMEEMKTMQTTQQISQFIMQYKLLAYGVASLITAFFSGFVYYITLIVFTEKGTVGTWFTGLCFKTNKGNRPTMINVTIWYFIKMLYPLFTIVCILLFIFKGITIHTLIFFFLAGIFSNIPSVMFSVRTVAEVISSIKIVKYTK